MHHLKPGMAVRDANLNPELREQIFAAARKAGIKVFNDYLDYKEFSHILFDEEGDIDCIGCLIDVTLIPAQEFLERLDDNFCEEIKEVPKWGKEYEFGTDEPVFWKKGKYIGMSPKQYSNYKYVAMTDGIYAYPNIRPLTKPLTTRLQDWLDSFPQDRSRADVLIRECIEALKGGSK